jgi:triosephosphate isomerase
MRIVCANWKMNKTKKEVLDFIKKVDNKLFKSKDKQVIFVSFPYLALLKDNLKNIKVGAQNCSSEGAGAYTGEVSAAQINDFADYVIIGHSERRGYFNEDDKVIAKKVKLAVSAGLKVILCVGENMQERELGKTKSIIKNKIIKNLSLLNTKEKEQVVIAYEPIWSISTTKNRKDCTKNDADEVFGLIKKITNNKNKILFGGNVNPENVSSYFEYNGFLIGGASLDAKNFLSIIKQSEGK